MKTKWICVLVLVFLAVLFMAACQNDNRENGNTSSPSQVKEDDQGEDGGSKKPGEGEDSVNHQEPGEKPEYPSPELLSPEIKSQIEKDYLSFLLDLDWFIKEASAKVWVENYYGTYDGYVFVTLNNSESHINVDRGVPHNIALYPLSITQIKAWKGGRFYLFNDVYDLGLLTQDNARNIATRCFTFSESLLYPQPSSEEPLTPEMIKLICTDWAVTYLLDRGYGFEPIAIAGYFGTYNGNVVVMINLPYLAVDWKTLIAGVQFHYINSNTMKLWSEGRFYELSDAYDRGLLTIEDLERIADTYLSVIRGGPIW